MMLLPFANLTFDQLTLEGARILVISAYSREESIRCCKKVEVRLKSNLQICSKKKLITYNPIEDIELPSPPKKNHAAIVEPRELALLVKAVWGYGELTS